jgi:hypothetical protein
VFGVPVHAMSGSCVGYFLIQHVGRVNLCLRSMKEKNFGDLVRQSNQYDARYEQTSSAVFRIASWHSNQFQGRAPFLGLNKNEGTTPLLHSFGADFRGPLVGCVCVSELPG